MQSDGNSEELNMELSANEQAEIDASTKASTDAAAQAAAAAAKAAEDAKAAADAQDPVREALSKTTAALEATTKIATDAIARETAREAEAAAAAKAAADAKAAEANKEPDWDAMKAALREKNEAGEIDDDEFETEREKLLDQRSEWRGAHAARKEFSRLQADAAEQMQASHLATQEQLWNAAYKAFETDPANAVILGDAIRTRAFNAELQQVGSANPDMSYAEMLSVTRANILTAFNIQQTTKEKADAAAKAELLRREREAGKGAPNLNNLPNSGADLSGGKYAHLDNLDIDALENALSKMSRDDQEAYLASSPGSDTRGKVD